MTTSSPGSPGAPSAAASPHSSRGLHPGTRNLKATSLMLVLLCCHQLCVPLRLEKLNEAPLQGPSPGPDLQARGSSEGAGQGCPCQAPSSTFGPWFPCPAPGQALKAVGTRPSFHPGPGSLGQLGSLLQNSVLSSPPPPHPTGFLPVQDAPGWPLAPDCLLWGQLGHIREKEMPDPGQNTSRCWGHVLGNQAGNPKVLTSFSSKGKGHQTFPGAL